ncbi:hypothetical protein [Streptomyces sp. NBC_00557]|uniref:hypothetical protein n=1 Tax=Streptomyces sp. NBC_00557 TaxID=2975776 RepID=UPI002E7FB718|nr:hypothetical protein [Streptomyces sp. NBC_00557]WUC37978.1 hypothetical protein OG956_29020 [Streptomyces sp. NBC_00557]
MPTSTSPRVLRPRAGATVILTALAAAGVSWVVAPTAAAQGENGDILIQPVGDHSEDGTDDAPVVCKFRLDAVNFDSLPLIAYTITPLPPLPSAATTAGTIQLGGGAGRTDVIGLADGKYTLGWIVGTPSSTTKQKIFRVSCHGRRHDERPGPGGQITDDHRDDGAWGRGAHNDPRGGVHAGGGGLIDKAAAYTPVAAAGAVGLTAIGGAVYFRRSRRRPHGAA